MPSKPPSLRKARPAPKPWATTRKSRQERGYGRAHELMRERLLAEDPLCYICEAAGRVTIATIADHRLAKAEGGTDERDNYGGVCAPCHAVKTAAESLRARTRSVMS